MTDEEMKEKFKHTVTLNSDASFMPNTSAGGYAVWIKYRGTKITKSGRLTSCKNSLDAELMSILNGLTIINRYIEKGWEVEKIIINTDCLGAVSKLNKSEHDDDIINTYKELDLHDIIDFRHVKGHSHTNTKRNWVNDWCDKEARKYARKLEKERLKI